jgi:4a-hydroxytetrahydrobiopterin dehydratase
MSVKIPSCEACRPDAQPVNDNDMQQFLTQLTGWSVEDREGVRMLEKRYRFNNFKSALEFTNRIGSIAEEVNHHPQIVTEWGAVTVRWWSHKIRDLHELDFALAKRCDL